MSASTFLERQRVRVSRAVVDGALRRFLESSGWLTLGQLATSAFGLLQVAVLSRVLGKDAYGALVLLITAALTARQLLSVRVWEWITSDFNSALERRDPVAAALSVKAGLVTSAAISTLALVLLALLAVPIERYVLKGAASVWLVPLFGLTFVGSFANDTCASVLRAGGRFRNLAVQSLVSAAGRLVVLGTIAWTLRRLDAIVAAYVVIELAFGAWLFAAASRSFRDAFGVVFWRVQTAPVWPVLSAQRWRLFYAGLLDTLKLGSARLDLLLLGILTTPASVAVYQVAFNFIDGIGRLVTPMTLVLFNDIARSTARADSAATLGIVRRTRLAGAAAGAVIGLALFALAEPLVWLVYGAAYVDAAKVLRILALCVPFWLSTLWMQPLFASLGRLRWSVELLLLATLSKLVLLVLCVPRYAAPGLALASAVFYALPALLAFWYLGRVRRHLQPAPE